MKDAYHNITFENKTYIKANNSSYISTYSLQYNTKSLSHNGGHRSIVQISHNTILMMSGKLEFTFVINLTKLDIVKHIFQTYHA